jgi:hypothetical protein
MPTGFKGAPSNRYLDRVDRALTKAVVVHEKRPTNPVARNIHIQNERTPHPQTDALSGSNQSGFGNSNNIVVSESEYSTIFAMLDKIDDDMGKELFRVTLDVEELCRSEYVMPLTVQKCNVITERLKNALSEYRSLTEDTLVHMRRFVNDITAVG